MATWLTHLRIAEILVGKNELGDLETPLFYLGNIAPDSGEPHENGYLPPKVLSHFGHSRNREYERFIREYMPRRQDGSFSFMLGYFVHLLADGIWVMEILSQKKGRFAKDFSTEDAFYDEMKRDLYTVDREFINNNTDFQPIKQLVEVSDFENDCFPFFSRDAFINQVDRVSFSITNMKTGDYFYRYIDPCEVEDYIDRASVSIMEKLKAYGIIS